jgi:chromosome segregation ATPase
MSYLEKRGQHSTGWWYGEYKHKTAGRFRARFKTDEADAYEAHVRAFGQEPDWAHTADLEELKRTVEKLSDDLRAAEERVSRLEEELSLTRRDIAALTPPEDTELKEWQAPRDTFKASDREAQPKGDDRRLWAGTFRTLSCQTAASLGEALSKLCY